MRTTISDSSLCTNNKRKKRNQTQKPISICYCLSLNKCWWSHLQHVKHFNTAQLLIHLQSYNQTTITIHKTNFVGIAAWNQHFKTQRWKMTVKITSKWPIGRWAQQKKSNNQMTCLIRIRIIAKFLRILFS